MWRRLFVIALLLGAAVAVSACPGDDIPSGPYIPPEKTAE